MEQSFDPTGFISECVSNLIRVGFDADTFETAKWTGLVALGFLALTIAVGFGTRVLKSATIEMPLSDSQFRWLLLVGAALVALPVVAKITSDQFNVNFQSEDRVFAQRICSEQLENTSKAAEIGALEARLAAVEQILNPEEASIIEGDPDGPVPEQSKPLPDPDLLGQAVSVFFRAGQERLATEVASILRAKGAGVAMRETDLTETSYSAQALEGEIILLHDGRGDAAASAARDILSSNNITIRATNALSALRGNGVQILIF